MSNEPIIPTHLYDIHGDNFSVWSTTPDPKPVRKKSIFDDMVPVGSAPKKDPKK